ncbi:MAG: AEC family transporter [Lachnospiraceae bacterium]|nr:AEC family transporter [Lachnospiraceae bacterium]MDD7379599.1 AEC family transporter [Lachnospiraceae bacterium]MDY4617859.1 AEC family transporter [Lachnospiraceae bacterium]
MLENFIYSINVTIPIFLVMILGYFLRRRGMLNENFVNVANKFNFDVTLPFMVFRDIAAVDIRSVFDLKYVLFCAIASSVCFWVVWGLAKLFMKDKSLIGAFVQASFRSSAAVMGLAFISNLYGPSAMGPLMIIGAVPLYNIYSVLVLTFEAEDDGTGRDTGKLKEACVNILKNPIIISIVLGLIVSLCKLDFPVLVDNTIDNVAKMATPLALITLGAGFEGKEALAKMKPTLWAAFIKLIGQAAIFIPIAIALGFTGEKLIAIMVMLAAPATPSCYIMAKNMKNDGVLTASIIVTTTLLAAFTLTGWIFILRSMGYI